MVMGDSLSLKYLSTPWLIRLWWQELATLVVCLSLDFLEYLIPPLMAPFVGDILDFAGVVFCVLFFGWIGSISLLELIPGLDVIPIFIITWLVWFIFKRWSTRMRMEYELERWR